MAALLDFAEYQDDVIEYLRSVDTKHTPKYQGRGFPNAISSILNVTLDVNLHCELTQLVS